MSEQLGTNVSDDPRRRPDGTLPCYYNRFHGTPCGKPATWYSNVASNFTDDWTWCDEHIGLVSPPETKRRIEA